MKESSVRGRDRYGDSVSVGFRGGDSVSVRDGVRNRGGGGGSIRVRDGVRIRIGDSARARISVGVRRPSRAQPTDAAPVNRPGPPPRPTDAAPNPAPESEPDAGAAPAPEVPSGRQNPRAPLSNGACHASDFSSRPPDLWNASRKFELGNARRARQPSSLPAPP